jgi:hypothetical protein
MWEHMEIIGVLYLKQEVTTEFSAAEAAGGTVLGIGLNASEASELVFIFFNQSLRQPFVCFQQ